MNEKRFLFSMPVKSYRLLKLIAMEHGKTMSFILNQAFREFSVKHYKQLPTIHSQKEEMKND